ncbi:MAG TPA: oxidoreductase [Bacteroidales bacterium]|nr:oxidoreductase [Bacteroidales bacterium]
MSSENIHIPGLKMRKTIVVSNALIAENVRVLKFKRNFTFESGQVIGITISQEIQPRLYSISSAETDEDIEILYEIRPEGLLTPQLAMLSTGSTVFISEPFGDFTSAKKNAWFIAAGTGIAPFLSAFRSGNRNYAKLIHGGRFLNSFYFESEISTYPIDFVRCCSQETGNGVYEGRLTVYLQNLPELPKNTDYYLCGSPEMVVQTRDILLLKGIKFENIFAEIYF